MSTITSRLSTTPSPNGDQSAPRRRYRRAIALAVIIASAVYACFFHNFRPQDDWLPGTVRTWPLPDSVQYASCIAFVDGLDQPLIGGGGMITSVDRNAFVRDVMKPGTNSLHHENQPSGIYGHIDNLRVGFRHEIAQIETKQSIKRHAPGRGSTISPNRWGVDETHGIIGPEWPSGGYRFQIETGEVESVPLEFPTNRGDVYQFGTDSWISLEAINRRVTLLHASAAEYVCEGTFPELTICDDGRVILSVHTGGLTLHTLKFADENWQLQSKPFVNKHSNVRSLAFDPVECRALLLEDKFGTARTSMFRSVVDGYGALLLVDCANGEVIARHDVEVQSPADRLPSSPWFRATFSPDGQKLFVVTTLARCIEVDVDTWIEACQ